VAELVFVDISALHALINKSNSMHAKSVSFLEAAHVRGYHLISTLHTLTQLVDELRQRMSDRVLTQVIDAIRQSQLIRFDPISQEDELEAWRIFDLLSGPEWSFSRCAAIAVMNRLKIERIFSFDSCFSSLGYRKKGQTNGSRIENCRIGLPENLAVNQLNQKNLSNYFGLVLLGFITGNHDADNSCMDVIKSCDILHNRFYGVIYTPENKLVMEHNTIELNGERPFRVAKSELKKEGHLIWIDN